MNRDFKYDIYKITNDKPYDFVGQFDNKYFRFEILSKNVTNGTELTIETQVFVQMDNLKVYESKFIYFLPFEQATSGDQGNYIVTELIYQSFCRECQRILKDSSGLITLVPITLNSILKTLTQGDN